MLPKILRILLALLLLRLLLMAFIPVFEPSEARYAAISANMARTGDFVVPRFTHNAEYQSFDGKPPLVFQAGGLFAKALGTDRPVSLQLSVRLFPLLSALALLVILYRSVKRRSDAATAALAVAVCATATAFYAAAGIAMTDMTLTCCVAGALLAYRTFADDFRLRTAALVAALLGAGMVTKGPVALVMFGLPVLADAALNRRWRAFLNWRWLVVSPVFLAVAVPWFVCIERVNPGAVWYFFYNENFLRFVSHDYGDRYGAGREAFRGVSILWALVATLPWSLAPVWSLVQRLRTRPSPAGLFHAALVRLRGPAGFEWTAVFAIVGFWCLTSRVLLYYLFPVVPLFAAGLALDGPRQRLERLVPWGALVSALVVGLGLVGGALFSDKMQGPRTRFHPLENHYAVEFYHGTPPPAELAVAREIFLQRQKAREERKAREAAAAAAKERAQ